MGSPAAADRFSILFGDARNSEPVRLDRAVPTSRDSAQAQHLTDRLHAGSPDAALAALKASPGEGRLVRELCEQLVAWALQDARVRNDTEARWLLHHLGVRSYHTPQVAFNRFRLIGSADERTAVHLVRPDGTVVCAAALDADRAYARRGLWSQLDPSTDTVSRKSFKRCASCAPHAAEFPDTAEPDPYPLIADPVRAATMDAELISGLEAKLRDRLPAWTVPTRKALRRLARTGYRYAVARHAAEMLAAGRPGVDLDGAARVIVRCWPNPAAHRSAERAAEQIRGNLPELAGAGHTPGR